MELYSLLLLGEKKERVCSRLFLLLVHSITIIIE